MYITTAHTVLSRSKSRASSGELTSSKYTQKTSILPFEVVLSVSRPVYTKKRNSKKKNLSGIYTVGLSNRRGIERRGCRPASCDSGPGVFLVAVALVVLVVVGLVVLVRLLVGLDTGQGQVLFANRVPVADRLDPRDVLEGQLAAQGTDMEGDALLGLEVLAAGALFRFREPLGSHLGAWRHSSGAAQAHHVHERRAFLVGGLLLALLDEVDQPGGAEIQRRGSGGRSGRENSLGI